MSKFAIKVVGVSLLCGSQIFHLYLVKAFLKPCDTLGDLLIRSGQRRLPLLRAVFNVRFPALSNKEKSL